MKKKFRMNRKGISTVIATIIIVAIAIVMSIAVAYWVMGIGGSFTRFEKLQFTSAYATSDTTNYYAILTLKNGGTSAASIDQVFLNGQPCSTSSASYAFNSTTINPGATVNGTVTMPKSSWTSGMDVEVKIQTAAGDQYPQMVILP